MNKVAIVTLIVGDNYKSMWEKFCKKSFEDYAKKYNFDLVLIEHAIDKSEKAQEKKLAWQKLLIGTIPELKKYETLIWIDADIIINVDFALNILEGVPKDRVGAVRYHSLLSQPLFSKIYVNRKGRRSSEEFKLEILEAHRLKASTSCLINSGVLVIPQNLVHVLESTYYKYASVNHPQHQEQVYLAYELYSNNLTYFIDDKFNAVWYEYKCGLYLENSSKELNKELIKKILSKVYFFHFAGNQEDMLLLE
jgi:hypothetical protein